MLQEYHFISSNIDDENAVFHTPTNAVFLLKKKSFDVFQSYISGKSIDNISAETNLPKDEINRFLSEINSRVAKKNVIKKKYDVNILDRITLHIANDCNLNCSYCYARGGRYSEPQKLMPEEKAIEIMDFFITNFVQINSLVFFGGEPLLNARVIKKICEYLLDLFKKKKMTYLPEFVIITNGTIINNEIIKLIRDYKITLTVSIDGPKEINDLHRVFKNNRGSYNRIHRFIDILQKNTSAKILFESTFTKDHLSMNYSEDNIHNFMKKEFGIYGTVVPVQNYNENHIYEPEQNENTQFFRKMSAMFNEPDNPEIIFNDDVVNTLNNLANCIPKEMCPIGSKMIAVSVDGKIYPCHINVGKEHLCLGNIAGENIFTNPEKFTESHPYIKLILKDTEPCKTCWARNLCGGCSLRGFFDNKTNTFLTHPREDFCKLQKEFISELILKSAKLQSDRSKWEKFITRLGKKKRRKY